MCPQSSSSVSQCGVSCPVSGGRGKLAAPVSPKLKRRARVECVAGADSLMGGCVPGVKASFFDFASHYIRSCRPRKGTHVNFSYVGGKRVQCGNHPNVTVASS